MVSDRNGDRAQLILVGALALAVLIIGVTIIANSAFVTDVDTVSEASPQIDEAREFEYESTKGARSLVLRLNHRHRNLTDEKLGEIVRGNVTVYSQLLAESYTSSHGHYANVTYHNDSSGYGSRVVQAGDFYITDAATNQSEWYIGRETEYREVGWFSMNVNLDRTDPEPMHLNVSNASGHWVNFTMNRTENGTKLRVHSNVSHAGNATTLCDPSGERVLLDLVGGDSFTGDCTFNGTDEMRGAFRVHVEHGDNAVGRYEVVYNDSIDTSRYDDCDRSPPPDANRPCAAPVVWKANVSTQFAGSELNYTNRFNVSVYEETP